MRTFITTIEWPNDDGHEVEIEVAYTAYPAVRGARDGRYGPAIEPDEPAHCEIESVTLVGDGRQIELTSEQEDRIYSEIADDEEGRYESAMESRWEARNDR